ncbi:hypothetical protein E4U33_006848 [Claviceps sp. LM78 group G4]|nr:hypothetical protein E4U33_006848 [Claviceps sp. LM78 group G4]
MKFSSILLACVPTAMAASLAYKAPPALLAMAKRSPQTCVLPGSYHVKNFEAHAPTNGTSMSSYKFTYVNTASNVTTKCHYHSGLKPHTLKGGEVANRFACKDKNVNFIWTPAQNSMTIVQNVCPDAKGKYEYAASGNVFIPVNCASGKCQLNTHSYNGTFTKMAPVQHPDVVQKKHRRGVAWSYDGYN